MRLIFITLLALMLATVVGLGATWMTATRGTDLGTLTIGAWTARPKTGTADVDPYSPGPPRPDSAPKRGGVDAVYRHHENGRDETGRLAERIAAQEDKDIACSRPNG